MTEPRDMNPILREIAALLRGYEAVAQGGPTAADLADAPTLILWSFLLRGDVHALAGSTPDHPYLLGHAIVTSQRIWAEPASGHARTRSRWYRLGTAAVEAPEVPFRGRILHPLLEAEAQALMERMPSILLAAAWPPQATGWRHRL